MPNDAGDRDNSSPRRLLATGSSSLMYLREPVGTERVGKYASGVFQRKFYPRDARLAMDPQDQSLPFGACPL